MAYLIPMSMRVQILRTTEIFYNVKLVHPDHGVFLREFKTYDELDQVLGTLLIDPGQLQQARNRFMNGYNSAALGEHTFTAEDLARYEFEKEIKNQ